MSWFDILKQTMDVAAINQQRESERQKRLKERQQQLAPKAAQYRTRFQETPASFAPATNEEKRRAENIGGFNPTQVRERKQRLENEQRKIEEAWAEKQRELEKRRTQLGPEMQELNNALNVGKQKVKEVLEEIKQKRLQNLTQDLDKIALQRKLDEAKNALKQYPMLSDMLGQLEAVEDMAQEA